MTNWINYSVALVFSLSLTPALAQDQTPIPPSRKPLSPERLVMPLFPAGWNEVFRDNGAVEVVEYMPDGQSAGAWQDKILLQVYNDLNDLPLDAIQRRMQGLNRNRCTGVIEGQLQSGLNNGYPSAFWTLGCRYLNNSPGEGIGETQYTKAIQGETSLYVLSRIWRTAAFGQDGPALSAQSINDGVAFLTTSTVCVPNSGDHPCQ
ncbi:MAG: hypothetical protein HOH20_11820 [Rhodospirillaceae bacterium]|nr:hypothetical protein [Rhodospirillaceae bacterium]